MVNAKPKGKVISMAAEREKNEKARLKVNDDADDELEFKFSDMLPLEDPGVTAFEGRLADF